MELIVTVILVLTGVTILYKVIPYRNLGERKPVLALLPKYKNKVIVGNSGNNIEEVLTSLGFIKNKGENGIAKYTRGSIIGDISIKLIKIKVCTKAIVDNELEYTVEAASLVAFDTGDHWQLTKELGEKLTNAY